MARFTAVAAFVTVLVLAASAPAQAQTCDLTQVIAADPLLTNLSYILSNVPDVNALFKAMPVNKTIFAATDGAFAKVMVGLQGLVGNSTTVSLATLFTTPAQRRATLAVFLYHILTGGAYGPADAPPATQPAAVFPTALSSLPVNISNTASNVTVVTPIATGGLPSYVVAPSRYPANSTCNIQVHAVDTVLQAVAPIASAAAYTIPCTPLTGLAGIGGAPNNIIGSTLFSSVVNMVFTPLEVAGLLTLPGTFFVPTDDAFSDLLANPLFAQIGGGNPAAALSSPLLREALRGLITYHINPTAPATLTLLSAQLAPNSPFVPTVLSLSGKPNTSDATLAITKSATGVVTVRGALGSVATVVQADQRYCLNTVVHTISAVLLPPFAASLLPPQAPAAASPPPVIVPTGAPKSGAAASAGSMVLLALAMILAMGAVLC